MMIYELNSASFKGLGPLGPADVARGAPRRGPASAASGPLGLFAARHGGLRAGGGGARQAHGEGGAESRTEAAEGEPTELQAPWARRGTVVGLRCEALEAELKEAEEERRKLRGAQREAREQAEKRQKLLAALEDHFEEPL